MRPKWYYDLSWDKLHFYANVHNLNAKWLAAIVMAESKDQEYLADYDPFFHSEYFPRTYAEPLGITVDTETMLQRTRIGVMQVYGAEFRELGYRGHLMQTVETAINLQTGCRIVKKYLERHGNIHDSYAAYNARGLRKTPGGMYTNQRAVDAFDAYLRELE